MFKGAGYAGCGSKLPNEITFINDKSAFKIFSTIIITKLASAFHGVRHILHLFNHSYVSTNVTCL